jgi:lysozyme
VANIKTKIAAGVLAASIALAGALAKRFEGDIRTVYRDPVGIRTVCEGHTGTGLVLGKVYTDAECTAFKRQDLLNANAVVDRCITAPLTANQRASLIDFAFNVGPGGKGAKDGLCTLKSGAQPSIRRLFNAGQYTAACNEFPKWNLQKLPGITKRREAERKLCLTA